LATGFNLVGSILPTSGDIVTNPLMNFTTEVKKDQVYVWSPTSSSYTAFTATGGGFPTHPVIPSVGEGFWYFSSTNTPNNWVEQFSVGQ